MIKFLLCDDDTDELNRISAIIAERYGADKAGIVKFNSPSDALDYIESGGGLCDAAILDIVMPEMTGAKLATEMRGRKFDGDIIFLTSTRGYAPESYEVDAFDYILKPVNAERLNKTLDKLEEKINGTDNAGIVLSSAKGARHIQFKNIIYAEAGNHVARFFLDGGEALTVRGSLSSFSDELLRDERFAKCHSSFILNMDKIKLLTERDAEMQTGERIPIARRYLAFKKQYIKWIMR